MMDVLFFLSAVAFVVVLIVSLDRIHQRRAERDAARFARRYLDQRYKQGEDR